MIDKELKEAEKLGFKKCIIPENNKKLLKEKLKLDIIGVKNIKEAMKAVRTAITKRKNTKEGGKLMLKNERGITIIALVVTVIVLVVLVSTGIKYGSYSLQEAKLKNYTYVMQQIQGRVDSVYEKMRMEAEPSYIRLNGEIMGVNISGVPDARTTLVDVKGIDYDGTNQNDKNLYPVDGLTIYRYFSREDLSKQLDIKDPQLDVIINFKTREVISVQGFKYEQYTYYTLKEATGKY